MAYSTIMPSLRQMGHCLSVTGSVGGDHAAPCHGRAGRPCDHRGNPARTAARRAEGDPRAPATSPHCDSNDATRTRSRSTGVALRPTVLWDTALDEQRPAGPANYDRGSSSRLQGPCRPDDRRGPGLCRPGPCVRSVLSRVEDDLLGLDLVALHELRALPQPVPDAADNHPRTATA